MQDYGPLGPDLPPWWIALAIIALALIACAVLGIAGTLAWVVWGIAG